MARTKTLLISPSPPLFSLSLFLSLSLSLYICMYVYINIYIIVKGLPANNQSMRMQASQHLVKVDLAGRLLESVDVDLPWPEVRFNPYVIRCLTGPMMHFAQCLLFF